MWDSWCWTLLLAGATLRSSSAQIVRKSCARRPRTGWTRKAFSSMRYSSRPLGDMRSDTVVKAELFDAYVRGRYNVVAVFDDRDQVADGCWRAMGIRTYQPAGGAF